MVISSARWVPATPVDEVLYDTGLVSIGRFRAAVDSPLFRDSGPTQRAIFVFPRTSVVIRHEGRSAFHADACTVTYYNQGQRYTREPVDPRGDACEWFSVRSDVLVEAIGSFDPSVSDRPNNPFNVMYGRSDPSSYLLQRLIVHYASSATRNQLAIEENVLSVLNRILALRYGAQHGSAPFDPSAGESATAGATAEVRRFLGTRYREASKLDDIALAAGCSVFHLCRLFRRDTGTTIHQHRLQLRLRRSLELVAAADSDLTAVALHLGFSSHSHFTEAFRQAFGTTPSRFRRRPSLRRIREMADRLPQRDARPITRSC